MARPKGRRDDRQELIYDWELVPVIVDLPIVCRVLAISKPTALRLVKDGALPAFRVGQSWRIRREDLMAFAGVVS